MQSVFEGLTEANKVEGVSLRLKAQQHPSFFLIKAYSLYLLSSVVFEYKKKEYTKRGEMKMSAARLCSGPSLTSYPGRKGRAGREEDIRGLFEINVVVSQCCRDLTT